MENSNSEGSFLEDTFSSARDLITDRFSSPLIFSFIISWSVINFKAILIALTKATDEFPIESKLELISNVLGSSSFVDGYHIWLTLLNGFIWPLIYALVYVFIYPSLDYKITVFTLKRKKDLRNARVDAETGIKYSYDDVKKIRIGYENSLNDLNRQLNNAVASVDMLRKESDYFKNQLIDFENLKSEIEKQKDSIETLKNYNENLKSEIEIQKNDVGSLKKSNVSLSSENEKIKKINEDVKNNNISQINKLHTLEKDYKNLKQLNDVSDKNLTAIRNENMQLRKQIKDILDEINKPKNTFPNIDSKYLKGTVLQKPSKNLLQVDNKTSISKIRLNETQRNIIKLLGDLYKNGHVSSLSVNEIREKLHLSQAEFNAAISKLLEASFINYKKHLDGSGRYSLLDNGLTKYQRLFVS